MTSSKNCAVREETLLTPLNVAQNSRYLDWDSQPSLFKRYPHFCYRTPLADHPSLAWLGETRRITDERSIAGKPYYCLNVPSAGNLHPIEIYVQIRNVSGLLSGIYHLDVLANDLVMIAEIAGEGIEPLVGLDRRFNGALVMISLVPFRSSWKYGLRGWRYLYLDLGHQIATLAASVRHFGYSMTKMSPSEGLNTLLGMGEEEFVGAVYGIGECSSRPVKPLSEPLMRVQPTEYATPQELLISWLKESSPYTDIPDPTVWETFRTLNRSRRSAREFNPDTPSDATLEALMRVSSPDSLEIYTIVLQAHAMQPGVYRNGKCAVNGDFVSQTIHLLLNQRFISGANMVILIHAENFCAASHIEAGVYAQELYMACEHHNVGCSGIGAFYDEEALHWSKNPLLYAVAIGGKV